MSTPTAPNGATAQARVLADELARAGVRHVVVCPGSRSAALAIAVHEDPRLAVHVHPDERSAAFVALGIGRATGVPAAVVVTSGTAVANLHPAAVEADLAGVPLLLLSADRPPELQDTGANQTVRQRDLLGPGLRWAADLGVAEDRADVVRAWRAVVSRAVAAAAGALGGLPGPVHLNVPAREPTVPVTDDGRTVGAPFTAPLEGRGAFAPWVDVRSVPRAAPPALVAELATRFAGVERGLILVGGEVGVWPGVPANVVDALARATGWPVLAEPQTPARQGARALAAGSWLAADAAFIDGHRPDLVLRIGRPTIQTSWCRLAAAGTQILIDAHGGWHDPWRSVAEMIVADPGRLLADVAAHLAVDTTSDWSASWAAADAAVAAAVSDVVAASSALTGLAVARAVLATVPPGATLVVGASLPVRDIDLVPAVRDDLRMISNRGAAGIDGTVGTTLGAAIATGLPTWAFLGDQTLLHDGNGLLLQPDAPAPSVTLVVVDNGGGHVFDALPPGRHAPGFARLFTAPHGRDLADLGRLHGIPATTVVEPADLPATLAARAGDGAGAALIIARVDPAIDAAEHRTVGAAVAAALR